MGYYIYLDLPNGQAETIRTFLADQIPSAEDLFPWVEIEGGLDNYLIPSIGKEVCAYGKKNHLGWYTSSGWPDEARVWAYGVLRWLALKTTGFYFYENEKVSVTVGTPVWNPPSGMVITDPYGIAPTDGFASEREIHEIDGKFAGYTVSKVITKRITNSITRRELMKLDAAWDG